MAVGLDGVAVVAVEHRQGFLRGRGDDVLRDYTQSVASGIHFGTAALINLESGHSLGWGEGGHGETPGGGGGGITD